MEKLGKLKDPSVLKFQTQIIRIPERKNRKTGGEGGIWFEFKNSRKSQKWKIQIKALSMPNTIDKTRPSEADYHQGQR